MSGVDTHLGFCHSPINICASAPAGVSMREQKCARKLTQEQQKPSCVQPLHPGYLTIG